MRKLMLSAAVVAVLVAGPVQAQMAVLDNSNLAQAINTARNTLKQIEKAQEQIDQAKRLYDSANGVTDIDSGLKVLDNPMLRGGLPSGVTDGAAYVSDSYSDLGDVGRRAEGIYGASDFRSGVRSADGALDVLGRRASRDQAIGEDALERAQVRGEGLGQMTDRLATATTQREVDEIGARGAIETAAAVNEQNRLTAIEMQREADERRRAVEAEAAWRRNGDAALKEGQAARDKAVASAMSKATQGGN